MNATVDQCECGTPLPRWPEFGPMISIRDDDAVKLAEFYQGKLDESKCEGCGRTLSPPPSLVVSFNEYALEYLYCGPATKQYPAVIDELQEGAKAKGNVVLSGYGSPEELRTVAWETLERRAVAFYEALHVILTTADDEAWAAIWPQVTSSACAAVLASRLASLPVRVDLTLRESLGSFTTERFSRGFQEVQARIWISMCERWELAHPPVATTLEHELTKYLATSAVIGGAPDLLFKHITSLSFESLDTGVRHAYLAAEATLHWLVQTPNPHADDWALSYLALEIMRKTRPLEEAAALAAFSVSEQRLRNTLERPALTRAVSRLISSGVMDTKKQDALRDAATILW